MKEDRVIRVVWNYKTSYYKDYKYSDHDVQMSPHNEILRIYEKGTGHMVAMYKNWERVEVI